MKATVNGTEIFFDVVGEGLKVTPTGMLEKPVCVVLHGGPGGDHSSYRPWLDPLSRYMQLIFVDHRGTGRSGMGLQESLTLEQFADDVEALRKTLGIAKWNVLGWSFGGMWALTYAVRHQRSIEKLILLDTTASWKENWKEVHKVIAKMGNASQKRVYRELLEGRLPGTKEAYKGWYETMLPLYYHRFNPRQAREEQERSRPSVETSHYMWKHVMSGYDLRDRLSGIHVPTMIMVGKYDWVLPVSQSRYLAGHIPGAKLVIFQSSGHMIFMEEPDKFLRNVRRFLNLR